MKKIITLILLIFINSDIYAQKGVIALGVESSLSGVTLIEYSLNPTIGYFISDKMMLGLGFNTSSINDDDKDPSVSPVDELVIELTDNTTSNDLLLTPFLRYYLSDAFYFSGGINIGSSTYNTIDKEGSWGIDQDGDDFYLGDNVYTSESSQSSFGLSLALGYTLSWNDKICFEPSISLNTSSGLEDNKTIVETVSQTIDANTGNLVTTITSVTTETQDPAPTVFSLGLNIGMHIRLGR